MVTTAYGIEAIWEGQPWIVRSFNKFTAWIGRDASGKFASSMEVDANRDITKLLIRAALDQRTERQFIPIITNSNKDL
jgi:hypothetical protein